MTADCSRLEECETSDSYCDFLVKISLSFFMARSRRKQSAGKISRHLRRPSLLPLEDFFDALRRLRKHRCQRVAVSQQNSTIRLQAHDPAPSRLRLDIRQTHSKQYPMRFI